MENQVIKITSAVDLVEKLAGSVKVPNEYRKIPVERLIQEAKRDYFRDRNKK